MKPFLLLAIRAEDAAADNEYASFLSLGGLAEGELCRVRLEQRALGDVDLGDWSGILLGGGPFNYSDPEDLKTPVQRRVEADLGGLLDKVVGTDFPFLGACFGIGALGRHQGAVLDRRFSEPVGPVEVTLTPQGRRDPLFSPLPAAFDAFTGHKEAISRLPGHAVLLASSAGCPVQAFRIGANVYATQFHPELDVDGLCTRVDVYKHAGYFEPDQADEIKARATRSHVTWPPAILRRFVERYGHGRQARAGPADAPDSRAAIMLVAAETISLIALIAVLAWAVTRPRGWPEAVAAVPAAVILIAAGAIPAGQAGAGARQLGPVIGFLAAILVLAHLCDDDGLFRACGGWMARASAGSPRRLLAQVFAIAAVTTAVLSLDATVVLLTPVVFATAARLEVRARPHVYACTHLANSGSLLLPVSNLTNLLAFAASGLAFGRFAALMAMPWLAAVGVEYAVFGRFFGADLNTRPARTAHPGPGPGLPVVTLVVVALTLAGFAGASAAGVNPAWAAFAGAAVLAARALARHTVTPLALVRAADLPFLLFVLGLGIVVKAVTDNGLGAALAPLLPGGTSLPALLAIAALAAALANVCNNLPAVLVLLPLAAPSGAGAVLAVLLGVNIGPNLTYTGSLATLLWRRILHHHGSAPDLGEFTRLGLLTVPPALVLGVLALWAGLHLLGG